ncbi:MAG: phage terminase large subunit [Alphaproteobacteria bacterium]|nr:phage terminase large subunit [Alphaproteobacteria bacterium]
MPTASGNDIGFELFLTTWNALQKYSTPRHHAKIARWLEECWARGARRLLLMAFRASGKSTIIAVFSAWLLYRDPDLRILVLSADQLLASKMVRNIRKIIEKHPLTSTLKPKKADQWASDRFTVRRRQELRDPSVLSAGLNSNITGMRADVIICDDVEVPNTCDTPGKRMDLRERLSENEFILVPGGFQIYMGTPHSWDTIYADTVPENRPDADIFLKDYERLRLPLLNAHGKSIWPERYSDQQIETLKRQAGPYKFASQMMLMPVTQTQGRLNPDLLCPYAEDLVTHEVHQKLFLSLCGRRLVSCSAWWDPAFGAGRRDSSVLAIIYTDDQGEYWLHRLMYLDIRGSIEDEATAQCQYIAQEIKRFFVPSVAIETNGIGKFLPAILRRELALKKIPCAVVEQVSTQPKDIRILEAFDAVMAARALHVHRSVMDTPFIQEMQEWYPGIKGAHDDGLDAAAGAIRLEPVRLKRVYFSGRQSWPTEY